MHMIKISKTTEKSKMKTDSIPFPHLHSHFPKVTTPNNFSGTPEPAERNAALILVICYSETQQAHSSDLWNHKMTNLWLF